MKTRMVSKLAHIGYHSDKRNLKFILSIVLVLFITYGAKCQEEAPKKAPIPIEVMFGNEELTYLAILNLPLKKDSKFGFFGVASALIPYKDEPESNNEIVLTNLMTYNFAGKFYGTAGFQFHYSKGLIPSTGVQFFSANPKWLFLFSSNLLWAPDTNVETVGIVEYKPKLSETLNLYTRFQGIYNQNMETGSHDRSLLYLRLGVTSKRTSFGFGLNLDFYGTTRAREENFGLFINHLF